MSQLRDIKDRIDSVQKTETMTKAMKMVAAAKFKKASGKVFSARPYVSSLTHLLDVVSLSYDDNNSPYMSENNVEKVAVVILSSDKGLCGGFNAAIIKKAEAYLKTLSVDVDLYLFGSKAYQHFKGKQWKIASHYEGLDVNFDLKSSSHYFSEIKEAFLSSEYKNVTVFYNEFESAISSKQKQFQILPFLSENSSESNIVLDYIYEPSSESVFNTLIEELIELKFYIAFLESFASEQGSRMAAMDSASENAGEMIQNLKLVYNRRRQAQITTELSEIVAGAEALAS